MVDGPISDQFPEVFGNQLARRPDELPNTDLRPILRSGRQVPSKSRRQTCNFAFGVIQSGRKRTLIGALEQMPGLPL